MSQGKQITLEQIAVDRINPDDVAGYVWKTMHSTPDDLEGKLNTLQTKGAMVHSVHSAFGKISVAGGLSVPIKEQWLFVIIYRIPLNKEGKVLVLSNDVNKG